MHLSGKLPLKQGIPIKVVVDNHFDRSGVKAWWHVELTDTNYLIDLFNCSLFCALCVFIICSSFFFIEDFMKRINGSVAIAQRYHLIPFRTQTWNFVAPMVLQLKLWKSRSLPNLLYALSFTSYFILSYPFYYLLYLICTPPPLGCFFYILKTPVRAVILKSYRYKKRKSFENNLQKPVQK